MLLLCHFAWIAPTKQCWSACHRAAKIVKKISSQLLLAVWYRPVSNMLGCLCCIHSRATTAMSPMWYWSISNMLGRMRSCWSHDWLWITSFILLAMRYWSISNLLGCMFPWTWFDRIKSSSKKSFQRNAHVPEHHALSSCSFINFSHKIKVTRHFIKSLFLFCIEFTQEKPFSIFFKPSKYDSYCMKYNDWLYSLDQNVLMILKMILLNTKMRLSVTMVVFHKILKYNTLLAGN